MKTIKIIATGGTFEKEYNEITGSFEILQTQIPRLLHKGRCKLKVALKMMVMKDSLHFKEHDRKAILKECQESSHERIIVIHGTDTMTQTAQLLEKHLRRKTIILTGAMIPAGFPKSDAEFNLGVALGLVQTLQPGVYISMNGQYFKPTSVRKDRTLGVFLKSL